MMINTAKNLTYTKPDKRSQVVADLRIINICEDSYNKSFKVLETGLKKGMVICKPRGLMIAVNYSGMDCEGYGGFSN